MAAIDWERIKRCSLHTDSST